MRIFLLVGIVQRITELYVPDCFKVISWLRLIALVGLLVTFLLPLQVFAADSCNAFTNGAQTHDGASGDIIMQSGSQVLGGGTVLAAPLLSDNANNLSCGSADCTASGASFFELTYSYPTGINYGGSSVSGNFTYTTSNTHFKNINMSSGGVNFQGDGLTRYIESFRVASGTITFAPGDYYFAGDLTISDNVTVNLTGTGAVRIFTHQSVNVQTLANFANISDPSRLFMWATNTINIAPNAQVKGFYYASTSSAELGSGATLLGGIAGSTQLVLNTNATVNFFSSDTLAITDGCGSPKTTPAILIARWHFDEAAYTGTGAEVKDASGNSYDATAVNNGGLPSTSSASPAIAGTTGTCGYGRFNQAGYVELPDPGVNSDFDFTDTYSIAMWVNRDQWPVAGLRESIVQKMGSYTVEIGADQKVYWWWYDGAVWQWLTSSVTLSLNTWHHIAVVAGSGSQTLYVDGNVVASSSIAGQVAQYDNSILIGERVVQGWDYFDGYIDEVNIYSGALTASQVTELSTQTHTCPDGPAETHLVAHWQFNEFEYNGTAGEVLDSGPNALHGFSNNSMGAQAITQSASPAIVGDPGSCRYLSVVGATTGFAEIPDPGIDSLLDFTNRFSMGAWVNIPDMDGAPFHTIFRKSGNYVMQVGSNGEVRFWWWGSDSTWHSLFSAAGTVSEGSWAHIAINFQNGLQEILVNGVSIATQTDTVNTVPDNNPLVLGKDTDGGLTFANIDDARIYDRPLSASEWSTIMTETQDCITLDDGLVGHWQFEQISYNGTVGEVIDSGPNALHGQSIQAGSSNHALTKSLSPALGGDPGSCRYLDVDGAAAGFVGINDPGDNSLLDFTNKFSLGAWVKVNNLSGNVKHTILSKSGNYILQIGDDGALLFWWWGSDNAWHNVYSSSGVITEGVWAHIAINFKNGLQELFVNGVSVATRTDAVDSVPSNNSLTIGNDDYVGPALASIDEVRIYNRVLTATEWAEVMAQTNSCNMGEQALLAEWTFDQTSWDGTAGEVIESTGNYPGQTFAQAQPGFATPALGDEVGTCQYAEFDGVSDGIKVPNFPNLTESFTVTAWLRNRNVTRGGQRIVGDDENNSGHMISLADARNNGSIRSIYRSSSGGVRDTIDNVVTNNTWHHVAVVHNAFNKTKRIYIDGVPAQLRSGGDIASFAQLNNGDPGDLTIGNESPLSAEYLNTGFDGFIDEVRIYQTPLAQADISSIMSQTRACNFNDLSHFTVTINSTASTCSPLSVTINAINNIGGIKTDFTGVINLSTSTGRGDWAKTGEAADALGGLTPGASYSGTASYAFVAGDNGSIQLNLSNPSSETLTIAVSDNASSAAGVSANITFATNGFKLSRLNAGNRIVGYPERFRLEMMSQDPTTGDCSVNTQYNQTQIKIWSRRIGNDPGAPGSVVIDDDTQASTVLPVDEPDEPNFDLTFVNGAAEFTHITSDVLMHELSFMDSSLEYVDVEVGLIAYRTIFGPFGYYVNVVANPAAVSALGASFVQAGQTFSVNVTAVAWQAEDDLNDDRIPDGHDVADSSVRANLANNPVINSFGKENPPESITLSSRLRLPVGGNNPGLGYVDSGIDERIITVFNNGTGTANNLYFDEVGIIDLKAEVTDGAYMGKGLLYTSPNNTYSQPVGRFYADHFTLSTATLTEACTSGLNFSYLGQSFGSQFSVNAKSARNSALQNYTGDFVKLVAGDFDFAARDINTNVVLSSRLANNITQITWGSGVGTIDVDLQLARAAAPDGPFTTVKIGTDFTDSDGAGLISSSKNIDTTGDAANDSAELGETEVRFGRLRLGDAHGPETYRLNIPLVVEYWQSPDWLINDDDSCTSLPLTAINYPTGTANIAANRTVALGSGSTTGSYFGLGSGVVPFINGEIEHAFSAPGSGNMGSLNTSIDLSAFPWLQFDWDADGNYTDSQTPDNQINFGSYRGHDRMIFWQEY